jgi:hypothetical protein
METVYCSRSDCKYYTYISGKGECCTRDVILLDEEGKCGNYRVEVSNAKNS